VIYFIQQANHTGPIKIGFSGDPKKRLAEIQRMSPVKLSIIKLLEGDKTREQGLHSQFRQYRLWGEWFEPVKVIKRFLQSRQNVMPLNDLELVGRRCEVCGHKMHVLLASHCQNHKGWDINYDKARCIGVTFYGERCRHLCISGKFCAFHESPNGGTGVNLDALED